jgi:hypothetical protein
MYNVITITVLSMISVSLRNAISVVNVGDISHIAYNMLIYFFVFDVFIAVTDYTC